MRVAAPADTILVPPVRRTLTGPAGEMLGWPAAIHRTVSPYLILCKLRVVGLVLFTGLVALAVAGGAPLWRAALFAVGGTLAAAGAAALNHWLDRDVDARMERTRRRPLPTGRLAAAVALRFGISLLLAGTALLVPLGWEVVRWSLVGALIYVGVYTLGLKRRNRWNVVIGGLTGSCAVLGGWQAGGAALSPTAWALAAVVFLWTPAHFWGLAIRRRDDYARAGIPMLPVIAGVPTAARSIAVAAALTVVASLIPIFTGDLGAVYGAVAVVAGAGFLMASLRVARRPEPAVAWTAYKLSGLYLLVLFLAMLPGH
ncbi:MAG: protoheme IX farnesyltransferase [Chloroflexi bacterium]|nr:protoheme IX farnesyltransferase [Chloroflexota bacterium]